MFAPIALRKVVALATLHAWRRVHGIVAAPGAAGNAEDTLALMGERLARDHRTGGEFHAAILARIAAIAESDLAPLRELFDFVLLVDPGLGRLKVAHRHGANHRQKATPGPVCSRDLAARCGKEPALHSSHGLRGSGDAGCLVLGPASFFQIRPGLHGDHE